jgi:hypothetical protein
MRKSLRSRQARTSPTCRPRKSTRAPTEPPGPPVVDFGDTLGANAASDIAIRADDTIDESAARPRQEYPAVGVHGESGQHRQLVVAKDLIRMTGA